MAPRLVLRQAAGAALPTPSPPAGRTVSTPRFSAPSPPASPPPTYPPPPALVANGRPEPGVGGEPASVGGSGAQMQAPVEAPAVDVDRLIEAIEERVLGEIERRGGRYTGVF